MGKLVDEKFRLAYSLAIVYEVAAAVVHDNILEFLDLGVFIIEFEPQGGLILLQLFVAVFNHVHQLFESLPLILVLIAFL